MFERKTDTVHLDANTCVRKKNHFLKINFMDKRINIVRGLYDKAAELLEKLKDDYNICLESGQVFREMRMETEVFCYDDREQSIYDLKMEVYRLLNRAESMRNELEKDYGAKFDFGFERK